MKRRARDRRRAARFPRDSGYDFGDANHLPIVPVIVEDIPEAGPEDTPQPAPGADSSGVKNDSTSNH